MRTSHTFGVLFLILIALLIAAFLMKKRKPSAPTAEGATEGVTTQIGFPTRSDVGFPFDGTSYVAGMDDTANVNQQNQ